MSIPKQTIFVTKKSVKVVLPMNAGMNADVSPLYIDAEKGEVIRRRNCRVTSTAGGKVGVNTSIRSMEQLTAYFPLDGTNKVIGFVEDKQRDQAFFFVYNSVGNHTIMKLSGTTITDLGFSADVLSFDSSEIIDATILGDTCVFVSDYNPPRKFDVTLSSLSSIGAYTIQLAVLPPSDKPEVNLASDATRKVNKLAGKTFQFSTMYLYNDYTYSVLSPYSDIVVSSAVFAAESNTYEDSSIGNYVQVTYDLGGADVRAVRLLAREGNNGLWFVVDEYEPNGDTTRTYPFYNDVARQGLVEQLALQLYSDVPRRARSVLSVQNRIGMANVLKGYDKTSVPFTCTVEYEDAEINGTSTPLTVTDGVYAEPSSNGYAYVRITMPVSVTEGDIVSVNLQEGFYYNLEIDNQWILSFNYSASYIVQAGDVVDDVTNFFYQDILAKGKSIITDVGAGDLFDMDVSSQQVGGGVDIMFVGVYYDGDSTNLGYTSTATVEVPPTGVSTFKSGSYYNVGVLLYDEYSRTSGVLNPVKVYVPHAGERAYADAYRRANIGFSLGSVTFPSWAKYYRFAVTESVNFAGVYPFMTSTDNIKSLYLDGQDVIAINMPTNLQYEFEKGDYLQIEVDSGAAITSTIVKNIIGTRTEVTISGTSYAGFWLIVPKGDQLTTDYEEKLMYIYRTKNQVEDLVYFEDSNTYSVASPTLTGYIGGADAWYVKRKFVWDGGSSDDVTTYSYVEDFYINVDDAIRAYSKGRAVVEFDSLGEIRLQDFVWSLNYLDNTKINGISMFNPLNRVQLDEKDGEIQRARLVGDVVKVVQDNKETSIYVGKTGYVDADGIMSVVKSNDFVGDVRPMAGDYGTRFARSIVTNGRSLYYYDGDEGVVVRSSPNGQEAISQYGYASEAIRFQSATDVLAYYDKANNTYVLTLTLPTGVETHVFKEPNTWEYEVDFTDSAGSGAEYYGTIGTACYSFLKEKVWKHESGSSYNVFYNDPKTLLLRGVVNISPRDMKVLKAIEISSNRALDTTFETPVTSTNLVGQKSLLYAESYRNRNGNWTSAVYKNILTTAGEDISLIHSGADICGDYIEVELTSDSTSETVIELVTLNIEGK